jgi:hypothetical protein
MALVLNFVVSKQSTHTCVRAYMYTLISGSPYSKTNFGLYPFSFTVKLLIRVLNA